jgi:hypothetical protein
VADGPTRREAEFTAFMAESTAALARTAWFLCGDEHQAEELVQQTFVRVWTHWGRARRGEPLAYARKVLSNLRIDSWRKHRREVLADPGRLPEGAAPSSPRSGSSPAARRVRASVSTANPFILSRAAPHLISRRAASPATSTAAISGTGSATPCGYDGADATTSAVSGPIASATADGTARRVPGSTGTVTGVSPR